MNCIDFRREKLADPRLLSDEGHAHAVACPGCAAFSMAVDADNAEIVRAVAVPVPEGLADRVLLRAMGSDQSAWRMWAMAASLFLGVALTIAFVFRQPSDHYAVSAIEHVVHEPESFTTIFRAESLSVEMALQSVGASTRSKLERVRYVRLCPWGEGGSAWHIVFETPQGLATLILVPAGGVHAREHATVRGLSAFVQPVRRGFYAVVTTSSTTTNRVAEMLNEHIDWNA